MSENQTFVAVANEAKNLELVLEAEKLLESRSDWSMVRTKDASQAVYFIRPRDWERPIGRFFGDDYARIINIGRTTRTKGMSDRSTEIVNGTHQGVRRLRNPRNQLGWVNDKPLELEYCFCPVKDEIHAVFWEGILLLSYYRRFGEPPPTNRRLEYIEIGGKIQNLQWMDFIKQFDDLRSIDWSLVSSKL